MRIVEVAAHKPMICLTVTLTVTVTLIGTVSDPVVAEDAGVGV